MHAPKTEKKTTASEIVLMRPHHVLFKHDAQSAEQIFAHLHHKF